MSVNDDKPIATDIAALWALAEAVCIGTATAEQHESLSAIIVANEDAALFYATYVRMHGRLLWHWRDESMATRQHVVDEPATPQIPSPSSFAPSLNVGWILFADWPMAYLIATVVMAIGLTIAAVTRVSQPDGTFVQSSGSPERNPKSPSLNYSPKATIVGRISGLVDCAWRQEIGEEGRATKNPKSETRNLNSVVALGDRFDICSGLLEITYDTGAKVILQGPVTYEVRSSNGGFLSLGKLTGKVEIKAARGFTVHTPTAVVTDLGTEFGVAVDRQGACHVRTFVGLIEVLPTLEGRPTDKACRVAAGKFLRVDRYGRIAAAVGRATTAFVRDMRRQESCYANCVLADRPVAYWRLNDLQGCTWVVDCTNRGHHGRVFGPIKFGQTGPLFDPRSRSAEFNGDSYIELQNTPNFNPTKGASVTVWARCDGPPSSGHARTVLSWCDEYPARHLFGCILYVNPRNLWGLQTGPGIFDHSWGEVTGPSPILGEWVHLAGVFEPVLAENRGSPNGIVKLYVNGQLAVSAARRLAGNQRPPLRIGARGTESLTAGDLFVGRLAEIAIYDHPLSQSQVRAQWDASQTEGSP